MSATERFVAVISPWEKLSDLVKHGFRAESLPEEKKVMVWRDDLPTKEGLVAELSRLGVAGADVRKKAPTEWKGVE
jgi:hypothetical protein